MVQVFESDWLPENEHALHYRVQRVQQAYTRGVDRRDWDLFESAYHPDAVDDRGSFTGTAAELADRMRNGNPDVTQMMHVTANLSLLEIDRDRREILAETYCVAWQQLAPGSSPVPPTFLRRDREEAGNGPHLFSVGVRYVDVIAERDSDLRIAHRKVLFEWTHADIAGGAGLLGDVATGIRSRDDQSYRSLEQFRAAEQGEGRS